MSTHESERQSGEIGSNIADDPAAVYHAFSLLGVFSDVLMGKKAEIATLLTIDSLDESRKQSIFDELLSWGYIEFVSYQYRITDAGRDIYQQFIANQDAKRKDIEDDWLHNDWFDHDVPLSYGSPWSEF